jgi:hypothetical protein
VAQESSEYRNRRTEDSSDYQGEAKGTTVEDESLFQRNDRISGEVARPRREGVGITPLVGIRLS